MMENPTKESIIHQFLSHTDANDHAVAKEFLEGENWNLERAMKSYNFMKNAKAPIHGPQKNVEQKKVNAASATVGGGGPGFKAQADSVVPVGGAVTGTVGLISLPQAQNTQSSSPTNTLVKKLKRGLSKTADNIGIVNKARDVVLQDVTEDAADHTQHLLDTPEFTFILPDLTIYPEDFRAFLHKDLIETSTLVTLEQAGRLNWWADMGACQRLLPLATTGDGNCLLHAASLGMWGFHDRLLTLRKALFTTLTNGEIRSKGALWRRWRWHQAQVNKESGLVYSEEEWKMEWENLLKLASTKPRTHPGSMGSCCDSAATKGLMERGSERDSDDESEVFYESLEEFHVFVLAHVLRRPVIVVADTILKDSNGEALAPIPFGGVYLPLECDKEECHRSPLLLTYDAAHFSALVAMDETGSPEDRPKLPAAMPLVDPEFELLPIHYLVDPGPNFAWGKNDCDPQKTKNSQISMENKLELIKKYMNIESVPIPSAHMTNNLLVVDLPETESRSRSNSFNNQHKTLSRSNSKESDESNESNGKNGKDKGKETKENMKNERDSLKDKGKVAKQMQTVAKSFGSIGKTMSKNLKKLGGISKNNKQGDKDVKGKANVGNLTQSTKVMTYTVEMLKDRDQILCVKLCYKRLDYQEAMIQNYLQAAETRFECDRELRKEQDKELKRKAEIKKQEQQAANAPMSCVFPGCEAKGTAATSYLCQSCFDKHKKEALDLERMPPPSQPANNQFRAPQTVAQAQQQYQHYQQQINREPSPRLGRAAVNGAHMVRQDTVVSSGKSKFYTEKEESHSVARPATDAVQRNNAELNNAKVMSSHPKTQVDLVKTPYVDDLSKGQSSGPRNKLPGGASVFVNNLSGAKQSETKALQAVNCPAKTRTQFTDVAVPPLRAEFGGPATVALPETTGPARQNAFKIKETTPVSTGYDKFDKQYDKALKEQCGGVNVGPLAPSQQPASVNLNIASNYPAWKQQPCKGENCTFYGTEQTGFLCSSCFKEKQRTLAYIAQKQTKL